MGPEGVVVVVLTVLVVVALVTERATLDVVGLGLLDGFGPLAVFAGLTLLCAALSSVVSNNAVAVLLTPIAISAAGTLAVGSGLEGEEAAGMTRAFILGIALSASVCFATPIGHQCNLMVYGPGGYRWGDYLRFGVPISLLAWLGICLLVPRLTGGF